MRRNRALKRYSAPLREFVYLDEVSVYSLVASRLGPIAVEFTEVEKTSLQSEISASFGTNTALNSELGSRFTSNQANSSQVLRKSIVQTTFKDLYEAEYQELAIRPLTNKHPNVQKLKDIMSSVDEFVGKGWVIDPERLTRGRLLEVEVLLEADSIYKISAVVNSVLEIIQGNSQLFELDSYEDISQMKSINQILEKLIAGLVPVRGLAVDYSVIIYDKKEWIVHRLLVEQLPDEEQNLCLPLCVVGVAEESLFWKDLRRVLFSNAQYRVLSRISKSGLQCNWSPVKLAGVLDSVTPDFSKLINTAGIDALRVIGRPNQIPGKGMQQELMVNALKAYAHMLVNHYHLTISQQNMIKIEVLAKEYSYLHDSVSNKRKAFKEISEYFVSNFNIKREPDILVHYRQEALKEVGFDFTCKANKLNCTTEPAASSPVNERYLDTEFISIYW